MNTEESPGSEIARVVIPEVVNIEAIRAVIGPSIDKVIDRSDSTLAAIAAGITDDEGMALAIRAAECLRDNGEDMLTDWREKFYMEQWYRPGELVREIFDGRLKRIKANKKALLGHVADYKARREREAKIAREKAEAEARRQREEAERKQREAEEAERRAKEAAEAEERRRKEAAEAEERRAKAEKEAEERRQREAREAAAAETARKLKEEEDARVAHAEVAHAEGNGSAKVDTILESATPIAPVLGKAEQAKSAEAVRLEEENARKIADEKARREREEAQAAEQRRKDAEAEAFRKREEADRAAAAATAAQAAAAATSVVKKEDTGTTGTTRWKWDLASDGTERGDVEAVLAILREIVEGRAPITYCGYNPKRPQDWRPTMIGDDVTALKDRFKCKGILVYPQVDEQLKRRVVGGRR